MGREEGPGGFPLPLLGRACSVEPALVLKSLEHRHHTPVLEEVCLWHAWGALVLQLPGSACASCLSPRAVGSSPSGWFLWLAERLGGGEGGWGSPLGKGACDELRCQHICANITNYFPHYKHPAGRQGSNQPKLFKIETEIAAQGSRGSWQSRAPPYQEFRVSLTSKNTTCFYCTSTF